MSLTRALLLWLLMLALPLQGLASVRWASCHDAPGSHAAVALAGAASIQGHVPGANDHHAGHGGHLDHGMLNADASASDDAEATTTCSVCAACCVVAAPAPVPTVLASEQEPGHAAPATFGAPPSAPPHRLERPPRAA